MYEDQFGEFVCEPPLKSSFWATAKYQDLRTSHNFFLMLLFNGLIVKGNLTRTSSNWLSPLGVHNNDLDAASQTLRA